MLTARRLLSTSAARQAVKPAPAGVPVAQKKAEEPSEAPEADEDGVIPKPADSVRIGEVRRLAALARPERKTITLAIGLLVVSSSVSLSIPFTIGRIIDVFSTTNHSLPISPLAAGGILAGFFAIGAAANVGRTILMRLAGQRIVARLRERAFQTVLSCDIGWHDLQGVKKSEQLQNQLADVKAAETGAKEKKEDKPEGVKSTGDVISRLGSDSALVGESLTRELSEGLRAMVTAIVGTGAMFMLSAKLTGIMLLIVPPISIAAVIYGRFLKKLSRQTQKAVGDMVAFSEEKLNGVRTVQAFNAQKLENEKFSRKVHKILDLAKTEAWASGLFFGGAGFSGNIVLLALLSYGGTLVAAGEITVGALTSLLVYTFYIGSSLIGLTSFFGTIMKGLGASSRVFELLDARSVSVLPGIGKSFPVQAKPQTITFENVRFTYPSRPGVEILKGVNLTVQPGSSVAIAGSSGSGKSTLAMLLMRYYDPNEGQIRYGNDGVREYVPEEWRRNVGLVPQEAALFSGTIAENIAFGRPEATKEEIADAARLANCQFVDDLPRGFETLVGPRGAMLSGGQRQRIAIARALCMKPRVLITDEATSALDAQSESLVNGAIARISANSSVTTILIAHRLSTLKTADQIVYMENGVVAEQGTWDELTSRPDGGFFRLVRSQMLAPASAPESETATTSAEAAARSDA